MQKLIFNRSDGRFGGRMIHIQLVKDGHIISHQRVPRLMKEMDLKPNLPDENYDNYHKRKYAYKPNIISKSEYYPEINKIWVSDITYIRVRKEHFQTAIDNNITQSFSKKGCPYDNSVAESFFASIKKEEIY